MVKFSGEECLDMLCLLGESKRNFTLAAFKYASLYPTRQHPEPTDIVELAYNVKNRGTLYSRSNGAGASSSKSTKKPKVPSLPTRVSTREIPAKVEPKATPPAETAKPVEIPTVPKGPPPAMDPDRFIEMYYEAQKEKRRGVVRFWLSDTDVKELNKDPRIKITKKSITVEPWRLSLKQLEAFRNPPKNENVAAPSSSTDQTSSDSPSDSGASQNKSGVTATKVESETATGRSKTEPAAKRKTERKTNGRFVKKSKC